MSEFANNKKLQRDMLVNFIAKYCFISLYPSAWLLKRVIL